MNALKFLIPVAVLTAIYFVFFASEMPGEIEFRGQTLGPREQVENNSIKDFDIYSYSDGSHRHVLLLVMATAQNSPSPDELLDFYVQNFSTQGFSFRSEDKRHLGTRHGEVIYMTVAPGMDAAMAYIQKSPDAPASLVEARDIFSDLEGFSLN